MPWMRVGIVDVGSNTIRLLVATRKGSKVVAHWEEREHLALGEEVARLGALPPARIEEAADCVGRYARIAREAGAGPLEVLVTAPGRQSTNAGELVRALSRASGTAARVLSADEEGQLAFAGAIMSARSLPESVGVCDVGGGSTEVVVGTVAGGPAWARSVDLGCLRVTARFLRDDPPGKAAVAAARPEVVECLAGVTPPLPQAALAAGGTARSLRKLVGGTLGREELEAALAILAERPAQRVAKTFGFDERRARTLPAGALILAAVRDRLGVDLEVARTGLREGAALALLDEAAAA